MKIVYRTYESIEASRKSFGNATRKKRVVAWITS
ncbi:unknown [Clostridium sp. CAG:277]|nr:unknown [Clostridium sp. CAG:277]